MIFEIRQFLGQARYTWRWARAGFGAPYPHYMKQSTLLRHSQPDSVFIETGTYRGSTSRYFAKRRFKVVTIEVHKPLFDRYSPELKRLGVDPRLGDSGELLGAILDEFREYPAFSVFLDGHYSGGATGQGAAAVPVVKEFRSLLEFIGKHPSKQFSIMIDDWRLFMPGGDPTYPERSGLIDFAETLSVQWKIENDIFIASTDLAPCER